MKKLMMMALMAAVATTAFAQDALVKEAKKQLAKSEFAQARTTLAPALTSTETLDKAEAWNVKSDIEYGVFSAELGKAREAKPFDTLAMYNAIVDGFKAAMECDKYDVQPNEKGKVKIRFRKANGMRYLPERSQLYNAGIIRYQHNDMVGAQDAWSVYIESASSSLFEGLQMGADEYMSDALYNTALLSYQQKNYEKAIQYAQRAAEIPEKAEEAQNLLLFAKKDNCKTHADTVAFINDLKELHRAHPDVARYYNLLQEYYTRSNDMAALLSWAEEEITINSENKLPWFLKGYALMQQEKWDDAVAAFKKCTEIDPSYTEGYFNAGVSLNSKARALQDQLADKNTGTITKANFEKVKAVLAESKGYLEKARELDPEREKCNWAYPLWQVYYALGETAKADEMEKLNSQN